MNAKWWERPACFVCDYWWALLLVLTLILAAFFTREYWLPILGIGTPAIPTATVAATPTARPPTIPTAPPPTSTSSGESLTKFIDPQGKYTLSYPENWPTQDVGNQVWQWTLPDGVVISVHYEPIVTGDTLESFAQEVTSRLPYDVLEQKQVQVGGQPAIRQEVAYPGQGQRVAVGYLVLYGGQKYQIALSGLDGLTLDNQNSIIQEFEQVLATFSFQP